MGTKCYLMCLTQPTKDSLIQVTHGSFYYAFIFKGFFAYRFCIIKYICNTNDIFYINRLKIFVNFSFLLLSQTL